MGGKRGMERDTAQSRQGYQKVADNDTTAYDLNLLPWSSLPFPVTHLGGKKGDKSDQFEDMFRSSSSLVATQNVGKPFCLWWLFLPGFHGWVRMRRNISTVPHI